MKRIGSFLTGLMPAGLAGAFFLLAFGRVTAPQDANRIVLLIFGWLYGVGVLALIRLFRVAPWGYPWVGLVAGPVPAVLVVTGDTPQEDLGGVWMLSALLGVLIGLMEWARVRRGEAERGD